MSLESRNFAMKMTAGSFALIPDSEISHVTSWAIQESEIPFVYFLNWNKLWLGLDSNFKPPRGATKWSKWCLGILFHGPTRRHNTISYHFNRIAYLLEKRHFNFVKPSLASVNLTCCSRKVKEANFTFHFFIISSVRKPLNKLAS